MPIVSQVGDTRLARKLKLALIDKVAGDDPLGRPVRVDDVTGLLADDDAKVIATGLGLDTKLVAQTLVDGLVTIAVDPAVSVTRVPTDLAGVMADDAALHSLSRDVQAVAHKIVERRLGGYCMENNMFFSTVLRSLGYDLYVSGARVSNALMGGSRDPEGFAGW